MQTCELNVGIVGMATVCPRRAARRRIAVIRIPTTDWLGIRRGKIWSGSSSCFYEGTEFAASWAFNERGPGTVLVAYDEGGAAYDIGVGYDGAIDALMIEE